MLQARVKAQVLVPLLHITPHIQQGVLLVLPVTLLTWQLPALPTHSQHIHHPLETYLPHTHLSPPHFAMLFHTLTLHFQSSRQADGKPFTSSATTLPAEGARDLLDTQPMARRTLGSETCTQICHCMMALRKPGFQKDFRPGKIQSPQAMYQKDERPYPSLSAFTKMRGTLSSNFQLRD